MNLKPNRRHFLALLASSAAGCVASDGTPLFGDQLSDPSSSNKITFANNMTGVYLRIYSQGRMLGSWEKTDVDGKPKYVYASAKIMPGESVSVDLGMRASGLNIAVEVKGFVIADDRYYGDLFQMISFPDYTGRYNDYNYSYYYQQPNIRPPQYYWDVRFLNLPPAPSTEAGTASGNTQSHADDGTLHPSDLPNIGLPVGFDK